MTPLLRSASLSILRPSAVAFCTLRMARPCPPPRGSWLPLAASALRMAACFRPRPEGSATASALRHEDGGFFSPRPAEWPRGARVRPSSASPWPPVSPWAAGCSSARPVYFYAPGSVATSRMERILPLMISRGQCGIELQIAYYIAQCRGGGFSMGPWVSAVCIKLRVGDLEKDHRVYLHGDIVLW